MTAKHRHSRARHDLAVWAVAIGIFLVLAASCGLIGAFL